MTTIRQLGDIVYSINSNVTTNTVVFSTSNQERARIDPVGNVGIGTSVPTQVLHVVGNALVTGTIVQGGIDTRSFAIAMSTALSI